MTFLYSVDQDTATPTKYTAGPWGNDLQHGGAPTALISWAAERLVPREPMQVVRITVIEPRGSGVGLGSRAEARPTGADL